MHAPPNREAGRDAALSTCFFIDHDYFLCADYSSLDRADTSGRETQPWLVDRSRATRKLTSSFGLPRTNSTVTRLHFRLA